MAAKRKTNKKADHAHAEMMSCVVDIDKICDMLEKINSRIYAAVPVQGTLPKCELIDAVRTTLQVLSRDIMCCADENYRVGERS